MTHTLTDITITKKGRYALFLDGMFLFSVDDETYMRNHLKVGNKFTDNDLDILKETTEVKGAKNYALHLISYKSYTRKMLIDKIATKTERQYAIIAADRMQDLGLLDDLDYSMRLSRDLVNLKKFSLSRVRQELKRRGICDDFVEEAIQQFEDLDVEMQIYKIIEKKYIKRLDEEKYRRRAINGLTRLGYKYSDINNVLRNLDEDSEYYNYSEDDV